MASGTKPIFGNRWQDSALSVLKKALHHRAVILAAVLLPILTTLFLVMWNKTLVMSPFPLAPKTQLNQLKRERLAPYKLLKPISIGPLLLNQLGSKEYVQWFMQEPDQPEGRSGRPISLFVTYCTGLPGQLPLTPETEYQGSGYEVVAQTPDEVTVTSRGQQIVVPLQIVEFKAKSPLIQNPHIWVYTFHANGKFRKDRTAVRLAIGNLTDRFAYFSNLEVSMDLDLQQFPKDQAVAAVKRFLQVAIPVLLEDHWPDWDAATRLPQPVIICPWLGPAVAYSGACVALLMMIGVSLRRLSGSRKWLVSAGLALLLVIVFAWSASSTQWWWHLARFFRVRLGGDRLRLAYPMPDLGRDLEGWHGGWNLLFGPLRKLAFVYRHNQPSGGWQVALPLWGLFLLVALLTILLRWLPRRRFPPGHCRKCGYNLTGNVSGICPECGEKVDVQAVPKR
jgi:hypothetical protein